MKIKKWRQAMEEEIKSIDKNDTWELTTLPKGQKAIGVKWVYKAKKKAKGEVEKYKPRLVEKGIEVKQTDEGIFICQERYAKEILKRFGMDKCNPVGTPIEHKIAKRILRYIKGTIDYGMFYSTSEDFKLVGYNDSDWAESKDDERSTSGFLFVVGNNAFTWSSKKQPIVTLSSCEAEYIAATSCVCHAIWLRNSEEGELSSMSSTVSSTFSDVISITSSSSGEIDDGGGGGGGGKLMRKCVGRRKVVEWGFTTVIGRRKEMEDAVAVVPGFMSTTCDHVGGCGGGGGGEVAPVHFFGVYDGHGGSQVAKFCAERLHEVIAEEWDQETVDGFKWKQKWEAVMSSSFERADNEVLTEAAAPEIVGSTAVVVVLSGCQIIVSNCGDSRAVLCRGTETIPLTVDQKPDRKDELLRIEEQDGKVIYWHGARVLGVLAMSRTTLFVI
uniref:protein-serine/threonine phosphatase n=1 Tax=Tanacetum cinerariifolium TaxID=118510 RepID=A0A6L2KR08_TANCI|nr:protein phosphatase 2C 56-like [Tanacetum cinerariifolium]